jgi:hypothetical protein
MTIFSIKVTKKPMYENDWRKLQPIRCLPLAPLAKKKNKIAAYEED